MEKVLWGGSPCRSLALVRAMRVFEMKWMGNGLGAMANGSRDIFNGSNEAVRDVARGASGAIYIISVVFYWQLLPTVAGISPRQVQYQLRCS